MTWRPRESNLLRSGPQVTCALQAIDALIGLPVQHVGRSGSEACPNTVGPRFGVMLKVVLTRPADSYVRTGTSAMPSWCRLQMRDDRICRIGAPAGSRSLLRTSAKWRLREGEVTRYPCGARGGPPHRQCRCVSGTVDTASMADTGDERLTERKPR